MSQQLVSSNAWQQRMIGEVVAGAAAAVAATAAASFSSANSLMHG
jgi:hypothetical protein